MPDVNLVGPVTGHPLDIATQEAQQAQAAAIAMEMIKGGLAPSGGPAIHTGGNNPFARDIPNFAGPIAQIMNAYMGSQKLDAANAAQRDLAQQYSEGLKAATGDFLNSMQPHAISTPMEGQQPAMQAPSQQDVMSAIIRAGASQYSPIAAMANKMMEGLAKQALTGADQTSLLTRANVVPSSIPGAIANTPWGPVITHPERIQLTPHVGEAPGGMPYTVNRGAAAGGQQAQTAGVLQPPTQPTAGPGEVLGGTPAAPAAPTQNFSPMSGAQRTAAAVAAPTGNKNPLDVGITRDALGNVKVIPGANETPAAVTQKDIGQKKIEELQASKAASQNFQKLAPALGQMLDLIQGSALGLGQDQILNARRLAVTLGMSQDDANQIKNTQTLLKLALPQAVSILHGISARPSQLEYANTINAAGATQEIDPRAAANVYKNLLTTGLNSMEIHNQNMSSASALPQIGPVQAKSYDLGVTPEQVLGSAVNDIKSHYQFTRGEGGIWKDLGLTGNSGPAAPATATYHFNTKGELVHD